MDFKLRKLERLAKSDPTLSNRLVHETLRSGILLPHPIKYPLYKRGIFEGELLGCVSAFKLIELQLQRTNYEWIYEATPKQWFSWILSAFLKKEATYGFDEIYMNKASENTESLLNYGFEFEWKMGNSRPKRSGERTWVSVNSKIDISVEDQSCKIIYENVTNNMEKALLSLNPSFFTHRELPYPIPEMQIIEYNSDPIIGYDEYGVPWIEEQEDVIPLELRGELILPTCKQLEEFYYQLYPTASHNNNWMSHALSYRGLLIECPSCQNIYSIYKDSDMDLPKAFCDNCQWNLINAYDGVGTILNHFLEQHQTHRAIRFNESYPLYIPPDCNAETRQKIINYFSNYEIIPI